MNGPRLPQDWIEFLQEYARPIDLTPENQSISYFNEGGNERTCFRRGNFNPSETLDNPISRALQEYEKGDPEPITRIAEELKEQVGITMERIEKPIENTEGIIMATIITHLIFRHRGKVFRTCDFV